MKRTLSVLLVLVLALGCLAPALAAEGETTGFTDVAPDAWYAQAVALCARKGVMVGTGEGVFSPDETLSYNQCLTLALRLHKLLQGAPAKPEKAITLTFADGTSLTSYGYCQKQPHPEVEHCAFFSDWWQWGSNDYFQLGLQTSGLAPVDSSDPESKAAYDAVMADINAWAKAHEGPATVTVGDMTVSGKLNCWAPGGYPVLAFHVDTSQEDFRAKEKVIRDAVYDKTNTVPAEGDGPDRVVFEPAPEDWGRVTFTLTLADGTALTGSSFDETPLPGQEPAEFRFMWGGWRRSEYGYLCASLIPDPALEPGSPAFRAANEALSQWGDAHEGAATVTFNGQTVSGTVDCWVPAGWVLAFHPDDGDSSEAGVAIHDALYAGDGVPDPDAWWRDAAWYLSQDEELSGQFAFQDEDRPATRWDFADALFSAAGELPAVRQADIPDLDRDFSPATAVYALYDAGILTGKDAYGTFDGDGSLTRAQAAVMAARVLDESQRVTTPLEPLPTEG